MEGIRGGFKIGGRPQQHVVLPERPAAVIIPPAGVDTAIAFLLPPPTTVHRIPAKIVEVAKGSIGIGEKIGVAGHRKGLAESIGIPALGKKGLVRTGR